MTIAVDAQPIIKSHKTGVGFYEYNIVKQFLSHWPENEYVLNCMAFRDQPRVSLALKPFTDMGGKLNVSAKMPYPAYRALWNFVPLPYSLFFGKGADVTLFFNYHAPPGVTGKKVIFVHDMVYRAFPETVRFRTKATLSLSLNASVRRADRIITISQFSKQEIVKYTGVDPGRVTVAPCGVDRGAFHPAGSESIRLAARKYKIPQPYLLYVGTLEPRKNIERLLDAYAQTIRGDPQAPALVLAGCKGWLYKSIFEKVEALGIQKRVFFPGYIGDADLPALYSGAAVFVFPSVYEGFGMPPLEAMACGAPVLTSSAASLPEAAGDAAVMVDPYDTAAIAAGIKRLLNDSALRRDLSEKGLRRAELFSWENPAKIIMGECEKLAGGGDAL